MKFLLVLACVLTAYLSVPVRGQHRMLPDHNLSTSDINNSHKCMYICNICADEVEVCANTHCTEVVDPAGIAKVVSECRDLETLMMYV